MSSKQRATARGIHRRNIERIAELEALKAGCLLDGKEWKQYPK